MPTVVDGSEKREGSGRINSRNGRPVFEETYSYIVEADNLNQTRLDILTTVGLPQVQVTLGPGGNTICKSSAATRRPTQPLLWDVQCDFSSEVDEDDSNDPSTDPSSWIPVYETKWEPLQEVVDKDFSDNPIVNSLGQPFETGLTITRKIPIWSFYQFEAATVTDEDIIDRHETVNQNTFKGRDPKTLLLYVLESVVGFYYGQKRRLTQYQLKYNHKTWTHKRLDTSTLYKDPTSPATWPFVSVIKDKNGDEIITPILGTLHKDGTGQPSGGYGAAPTFYPQLDKTKENVGVIEFEIYEESDFAFLRLPP